MDDRGRIANDFDYADIYEDVTRRARVGAVFVEVGAYLGRSTLYLASCIRRSGKNISLYAVDRWEDVFPQFIDNVRRAGVEDVIFPLRMESEQAAQLFEFATLDFVFFASGCEYQAVRRDLEAWFPYVKLRGILGGHAYLHPTNLGVRRAVDEFFHEQELPVQIVGTSFLVPKPTPRWLNASFRAYRRLAPSCKRHLI